MFRNMVTSLLAHERVTTTDAKAKELRSVAEKMITLGKRGDLHAVRQAASYIRDKKVVTKLFETIAPRYKERNGGYTRIVKLGSRLGDNASMSIIELVEEELTPKQVVKPVKKVASPVVAPQKAAEPEAEKPAEVEEPSSVTTVITEGEETCEAKAD
jgi:large subunit ribosomal protein L17